MSCKGIKASSNSDETSDTSEATNTISISGGTFTLNTADDASQAYIKYSSSTISSEKTINVKYSGTTIYNIKAVKDVNYVIYSLPDMSSSTNYTITSDNSELIDVITETGNVNVTYQDDSGNVLASELLTGIVGNSYATTAKAIEGYTLKITPSNAAGTYKEADITVIYVYSKDTADELEVSLKTSASAINVGSAVTLTATATGGSGNYTYSYLVYNQTTGEWYRFSEFTSSNILAWTASSAGVRQFYAEVKDSTGTVVRSNAVRVVTK